MPDDTQPSDVPQQQSESDRAKADAKQAERARNAADPATKDKEAPTSNTYGNTRDAGQELKKD
jgi:hypothetical protein